MRAQLPVILLSCLIAMSVLKAEEKPKDGKPKEPGKNEKGNKEGKTGGDLESLPMVRNIKNIKLEIPSHFRVQSHTRVEDVMGMTQPFYDYDAATRSHLYRDEIHPDISISVISLWRIYKPNFIIPDPKIMKDNNIEFLPTPPPASLHEPVKALLKFRQFDGTRWFQKWVAILVYKYQISVIVGSYPEEKGDTVGFELRRIIEFAKIDV